jgi:hypothetical protein
LTKVEKPVLLCYSNSRDRIMRIGSIKSFVTNEELLF